MSELRYTDEGDPERPAVLLLRGEGDADPWRHVAPMLAPWMRVIALGPLSPAAGTPAEQAGRVRELLGRLGVDRCAVAGEGVAGPVAQALALGGGVEAMVLVGSRPLDGAEDALASLDVPTLVVLGEDDQLLPAPEIGDRFAEILSMGSVALLPGRGHAPLEEAPETVGPLVFQWLRSQYLRVPHVHEAGPVVVQLGRGPIGEDA